ncbi:MAG: hypothetical protein Q27BPR15_19230 [Rhodobacter sp. CACIA14H1]|nr:MAG: hypothetical protein Q27BPR15_19230 [Rhodobacter sp. CACIA14H1]
MMVTMLALLAVPAFADGMETGTSQGERVSAQATVNGTLHAGHMATVANGKYNTPSAAYHLDAEGNDLPAGKTGYRSGPGGYAETKKAMR